MLSEDYAEIIDEDGDYSTPAGIKYKIQFDYFAFKYKQYTM